MKTIHELLREHPFFDAFSEDECTLIAGCGKNHVFKKDDYLAHEKQSADVFYLIKKGHVAVSMPIPSNQRHTIQTLGKNEVFGWSWLFPPFEWNFDAIALETTHCIVLNGKCLREKLDKDPALGYKLMKQFSQIIIHRLNAARLQLLDVYGKSSS